MIIRLLGTSSEINIKCNNAILSHVTNSLSMSFENDNIARETESMLKCKNIKTKHNDSEITILNVSDYELMFI
jgi:hypothetical protein